MDNKAMGGLLALGALYLWSQNSATSSSDLYVDPTSGMTAVIDPDLPDENVTTTYTGGGSGANTDEGGVAYTDNTISFYDPTSSVMDFVVEQFQPTIDHSDDSTIMDNRTAFLKTIQDTEGTSQYADPYQVIFGGIELDPPDYTDHPGNLGFTDWTRFMVKGKQTYSTAAGAYQFLVGTWNRLKNKLGLPDFSPESQDLAALELIREKGALNDIDNGDVISATAKVRKIWASLPDANYPGQSSKTMDYVVSRFNSYKNVA